MKRLQLDFVQRRLWQLPVAGRERQLLIGLALVAVVAGGAIGAKWLLLDRAIDQAALAIAVAQQEVDRRAPVRQAPLVLSKQQIEAANRVIAQLNTPWPALLDGFERVASADIALLTIEPDHRRGVVKASAEARNHRQMLDYLAALGSVRPFVGAMVSKQEVNEKDPNRPLRFLFEALLDQPAAFAAPAGGPGEADQ
jgi:Tfp pilus assembly protein PilN